LNVGDGAAPRADAQDDFGQSVRVGLHPTIRFVNAVRALPCLG
jgi:hypothetical protein